MKTIEEAAKETCKNIICKRCGDQYICQKDETIFRCWATIEYLETFKSGVEFAQIRQHINSYDELIIGQYYWIKLSDKWFPALYKFNGHFIIDGLAIPKNSISLENIEPLKHE